MFRNIYSKLPADQTRNNTKSFVEINMGAIDENNHSDQNSSTLLGSTKPNRRSRSPSPSHVPLLDSGTSRLDPAPIARIEMDDDDLSSNKEVMTNNNNNNPYPGIDDGFFTNEKDGDTNKPPPNNDESTQPDNPDVEFVNPNEPEYPLDIDLQPRVGPTDGDSNNRPTTDEPDSGKPPVDIPKINPPSEFPTGFRPWGFDFETGTNVNTLPSGEIIPDLNVYQHKKTLAQGMMDLALFSANANQLRYVLETFRSHPYFYPSLVLISISLLMQVAVGIGLIWNATYNVKDQRALCIANKINNFTIIGVFLVTVINVFISAFGVAPAPP